MEAKGHRLMAVRLDSGDFDSLSRQVRQILNGAGLEYVQIVASGGLDEYQIETLAEAGAPIDIFGVGTKPGVSADAPWSDMAYKLVCYDDRPVMKLSTDKESLPGAKQVYRLEDRSGQFTQDILGLQDERELKGTPLLTKVMDGGRFNYQHIPLQQIREQFCQDFSKMDQRFKVLVGPPHYPVTISPQLEQLTARTRDETVATQLTQAS